MAYDFSWDKNLQRYRYTSGVGKGQFVSKAAIANVLSKHINQLKTDARTVTDLLIERKISVSTWETTVAQILKKGSIQQWIVARGGSPQLTQRDYGLVGQQLRSQYNLLRGFSQDILAGKLTEAQIRARLELYLRAIATLHQNGLRESHLQAGYVNERNKLNPGESCVQCVGETRKGWQPIGALIAIGSRTCQVNCNCVMEFTKETRPKSSITFNWGWLSG